MGEPRGEPLGKPHLYDRSPSRCLRFTLVLYRGSDGGVIKSFASMPMTLRSSTIIEESIMDDRLNNIHPGEVLKEEFLEPLSITAYRLSKDTGIPQTRLSEIIWGRRRITAATALRLGKYFGVSPRFWLGLQNDYDLEEEQEQLAQSLEEIPTVPRSS